MDHRRDRQPESRKAQDDLTGRRQKDGRHEFQRCLE